MERVQYNGPDEQVNFEVAAETGGPITLEHGHVYEVNADLADRLVASSQHFERAGEPSLTQLREQAAELGVEGVDKLGKQAVKAAIAEAKATSSDADGITDGEVSPDA
jgi:hypothetical protein